MRSRALRLDNCCSVCRIHFRRLHLQKLLRIRLISKLSHPIPSLHWSSPRSNRSNSHCQKWRLQNRNWLVRSNCTHWHDDECSFLQWMRLQKHIYAAEESCRIRQPWHQSHWWWISPNRKCPNACNANLNLAMDILRFGLFRRTIVLILRATNRLNQIVKGKTNPVPTWSVFLMRST